MLTSDEILLLCERFTLCEQAQAVLAHIRSSPPSRRVGGGGKNVPVRYPSRKMGVIIQAESRTVEFAGVYLMEHDPAVLEFWDQPPPITLHYPVQLKNGRTRTMGVLHTPDYFVIREDSLGWEEWKTEEELLRFARNESKRYVLTPDGQWCCPPGEAVAAPLGFYYRVRSSREIDVPFQRNLRFLSYYLHEEHASVHPSAKEEVLALVTNNPGSPLDEVLKRIERATADDVYTLLAHSHLYVDLSAAPLAEPERVSLFCDEETSRAWTATLASATTLPHSRPQTILLQAGAPLVWDGRPWTILNIGETTTALLAADGTLIELPTSRFQALVNQGRFTGLTDAPTQGSLSPQVRERLMGASKEALLEASRRYQLIKPVLDGTTSTDNTSAGRAMRRWAARYRQAAQAYGCGYVGLLPDYHQCGNRQPRFPESTLQILTAFIDTAYEHHKQKSKREVYGEFVNCCQAQGMVSIPSYKTFVAAVNRRPRYEQVKKRAGHRAAYPQEPLYWELSSSLPPHGDRPFEIAHIDHTKLDVQLVDSRTRQPFGRPWATFLTDAFSRRILAVYLSFDEPSYRSCMMVLRECVHRYRRFPELLVVDWGPEFESVYFETLLARYECSKATRPKAKPRFGSVIERLFGTTNSAFIHNLAGNTQVMKNVRQVTKAVDPKQHAVWTLGSLYAELRRFAYSVYDTSPHGTLKQTPKEVFESGFLRTGCRPKQVIPYDDEFIFWTLPTTRKETAKLLPLRGVKINNLFYWAKGDVFLEHPELEKTQLPVRYDPYDMGHAYVSIKGKPVECISEHYAQFKGHSERELHIATEELRRRNRHHSQQFTVTAAKLAAFITSVEAHEVLLAQRQRDDEVKVVLALMEGTQGLLEPSSAVVCEQSPSAPALIPSTQPAALPDESPADDDIYEDF